MLLILRVWGIVIGFKHLKQKPSLTSSSSGWFNRTNNFLVASSFSGRFNRTNSYLVRCDLKGVNWGVIFFFLFLSFSVKSHVRKRGEQGYLYAKGRRWCLSGLRLFTMMLVRGRFYCWHPWTVLLRKGYTRV